MLSKRLNAVASFVPKGAQAIDIGCDHGYLGIYLVKESLVKRLNEKICDDLKKYPDIKQKYRFELQEIKSVAKNFKGE